MNLLSRVLVAGLFATFLFELGLAGNTTCVGNALDWYTSAVGETPCITYQRLRQICNSEYQVPSFRPNTPGDNCNDQLCCCCNSVSWALSMLCMNCQQDQNGGNINGIDAGVGAYEDYLDGCGYGTNQSLPVNIQAATCNVGIRLDDFLYTLFWNNGAWFYTYTREFAQTAQAANNNNTFTHCPNSTTTSSVHSSATASSQSTTATPHSTTTTAQSSGSSSPILHSGSHSMTAAIAGGVVGGAVALIALLLGAYYIRRRRYVKPHALEVIDPSSPVGEQYDPRMSSITPFILPATSTTEASTVFGTEQTFPRTAMTTSSAPFTDAEVHTHSLYQTGYLDVAKRPTSSGERRTLFSASDLWSSSHLDPSSLRHEDAGPLERSLSGRLPPAYQPAWRADETAE